MDHERPIIILYFGFENIAGLFGKFSLEDGWFSSIDTEGSENSIGRNYGVIENLDVIGDGDIIAL